MASRSTADAGRQTLVWLLAAIYAVTQIAQPLSGNAIPSPAFNAVITLSSFAAALVHGSIRYGWRGIATFALLTIAISNALENLSVMTGFPFGWYYYSEALGPRLLHVPLVIGPAYFSVGYLAWTVANAIMGEADRNARPLDWLMLPAVSAFVMVGWDVAMDPLQSTVAGYWVWRRSDRAVQHLQTPIQRVPLRHGPCWRARPLVARMERSAIRVRRRRRGRPALRAGALHSASEDARERAYPGYRHPFQG